MLTKRIAGYGSLLNDSSLLPPARLTSSSARCSVHPRHCEPLGPRPGGPMSSFTHDERAKVKHAQGRIAVAMVLA